MFDILDPPLEEFLDAPMNKKENLSIEVLFFVSVYS
jgi:hypothetical protein